MAGVANEDLVESKQGLAVVSGCLNHGPDLHMFAEGWRSDPCQQSGRCLRWMRYQYAGVAFGLGIDPDDRLSVEVLGHVRHEPVLSDNDDHVVAGVQESVEVRPFDLSATPLDRNGGRHCRQCCLLPGVAGLDLLKGPSPAAKEERSLRTGPVTGQQLVELGVPVHDHGPRSKRHCVAPLPAPLCPAKRARIGVSKSGVTVSVPISGTWAASSLSAKPSSVAPSTSRYAARRAASASASAKPTKRVASAWAWASTPCRWASPSAPIRPAAVASWARCRSFWPR